MRTEGKASQTAETLSTAVDAKAGENYSRRSLVYETTIVRRKTHKSLCR
jgi:hypothetical protein